MQGRFFASILYRQGFPRFPGVDGFMLRSMILEDSPYIVHRANGQNVAQEENEANHAIYKIENPPVLNSGEICLKPGGNPQRSQYKKEDRHNGGDSHRYGDGHCLTSLRFSGLDLALRLEILHSDIEGEVQRANSQCQ